MKLKLTYRSHRWYYNYVRLLRLRPVLLCARQDKDHIFCSDKYSFGPSKIEAYDLLVNRQEPYPLTTKADICR